MRILQKHDALFEAGVNSFSDLEYVDELEEYRQYEEELRAWHEEALGARQRLSCPGIRQNTFDRITSLS